MKKTIALLLVLALMASFTAMAFADDEVVLDYPEAGVKFSLPAEFKETKGSYDVLMSGELGYDQYALVLAYIGIDEAEGDKISEAMQNPDLTEEEAQALSSQLFSAMKPLCQVYVYADEAAADADLETTRQASPNASMKKLGEADGYYFYAMYTGEEDDAGAMKPEFAEEYKKLFAAVDKALESAEFSAPVKPEDPFKGIELKFETTDLDGNTVKSEELFAQNKITMLNIWATWCGPCKGELPDLGKLEATLKEMGCGLVGLLDDGTEPEAITEAKTLLQDAGANYLNLTPPAGFDDNLPLEGIPTSLFVDSNGVVLGSVVGAYVDAYVPTVQALLAESAAPEKSAAPKVEAGLSKSAPAQSADGYRVLVSDPDGNPVEGVTVQFCSADSCFLGKTDATGAASFDMPGGEVYTVHILKVPQGYEKNSQEFETQDVPSDLSITINKAA